MPCFNLRCLVMAYDRVIAKRGSATVRNFVRSGAAASFALSSLLLFALRLVLRSPLLLALCAGGCLYFFVRGVLLLRRDPYDLSLLREVHERGQLPESEAEDAPDDAVYCRHCHEAYPASCLQCPRCGRTS